MTEFLTWFGSPFPTRLGALCKRAISLSALYWLLFIVLRLCGPKSPFQLLDVPALQILPLYTSLLLCACFVVVVLSLFRLDTGFWPCLAALCLILIQRRIPLLGIGPEFLIPHALILSAFSRRDNASNSASSIKEGWGLRLVSLFAVSVIGAAGISKLVSATWWTPDHLALVFNTPASALPFFDGCDIAGTLHLFAVLTVVVEVGAPVLLLFTRFRAIGIGALLTLFLGVSLLMKTAFFGTTILVMLLPLLEHLRITDRCKGTTGVNCRAGDGEQVLSS